MDFSRGTIFFFDSGSLCPLLPKSIISPHRGSFLSSYWLLDVDGTSSIAPNEFNHPSEKQSFDLFFRASWVKKISIPT